MRLVSLPDACILTVLLCLDVQDALRFRGMCRRRIKSLLEQSQNDFWLPAPAQGLWCAAPGRMHSMHSMLACSTASCHVCQQRLAETGCSVSVSSEGAEMKEGKLSPRRCALVRQAVRDGTALSSVYRIVHVAVHTPMQKPVRYVGVYTDGGEALQQHGVDNLCAPVSLHL